MSEGQEPEDRQHDASERRIEKAYEQGDVPRSQEVPALFTLAAGGMTLGIVLAVQGDSLLSRLGGMLGTVHRPFGIGVAAHGTAGIMLSTLAAPFAVVMVAAIAGNMVMHRPLLTTEMLAPKMSRISPLSGAKRLFGAENLVQFLKTVAKLGLVITVAVAVLWPDAGTLQQSARLASPVSVMTEMARRCAALFFLILPVFALIAGLDAFYQRFAWKKRLRMSHQEVKEEHKESEGSPEIKAKLRQMRSQRGRQRMMAAVPQATVIITNPTHFAVALRYEAGMPAPVCLAKGVDALALKIREIAGEHRIPIVENPPLARALHATVDIDEEIPADHYKAVAEVIGYVMRLRNRRKR